MTADEWPGLPPTESHEQERARLAWWQEKRRVEEALAKPPSERTEREWTVIQYSPFGSGQSCPATAFLLGSR
jgi:hypothetical protein